MIAKNSLFSIQKYEVEHESALEFLNPHTYLRDSHFRLFGIYAYICIYYPFVFLMRVISSLCLFEKVNCTFLLISKSSLCMMLNCIRFVGESETECCEQETNLR